MNPLVAMKPTQGALPTLRAATDPTFLEWTKSSGFESELSPLPASHFRELKQRELDFWNKQEPVLKKVAG